jgi:phosphopantetheine adenylyltransferase
MESNPTKLGGHWVIKKEISIGDIVAFVVAASAVITAYFTLDKRLTIVETLQDKQVALDKAQDTERQTLKNDIHSALDKMDTKLDWLIQRQSK